MTQHLTADLIAEALDTEGIEVDVQPTEGWDCIVAFINMGGGVIQAILCDDNNDDFPDADGVEARTFRLVEVES